MKKIRFNQTGFYRFKKIKNKYLLTNDIGDFVFITEEEFKKFTQGRIKKNSTVYKKLDKKYFTSKSWHCQNCQKQMIQRYAQQRRYLNWGPVLHVIVVTLRCDHGCIYCQASSKSMDRKDLDMTEKTAKKVVDLIFQTTSPSITIEFQGGEPLANFEIIKFITDYALKKNRMAKKKLWFSAVSTLSLINNKKLNWLFLKKISLCTSLDGPEKLQNKNRPMLNGENSYLLTVHGLKKARKKYQNSSYGDINALMTTTRNSLPLWKEIVDEYVKLGLKGIHLRPLNPFGMAKSLQGVIGYTAEEFLEFYKKSLNYIIKLNIKGIKINERTATIITQKVFTDNDPNFLDLRSPCGAGIGQIAYHYNGDVYTCDEGRMIGQMGDQTFKMGNVYKNTYKETISSPVTKSMCIASTLDGLAGCSDCVYLPYCGVCPVFNYSEGKNIFSDGPNNFRCKVNKGILDYLFQKFEDPKSLRIFKGWIGKNK